MKSICILAFLVANAAVAVAAPPKAIDPDRIEDKVSLKPRQEFAFQFVREKDNLLKPTRVEGKEDRNATVRVKLDVTSASPLRVREGATRPFLEVINHFEETLHYRVLLRLKGGKEFFEVGEGVGPILPGEGACRCWEFDSLVEEVILYDFSLSKKPSE